MCVVDLNSVSIIKPKSCTESKQVMMSFPILIAVFLASVFNRLCLLPTMINSVFLFFSFKRLVLIWSLISCMQLCRLVRHLSLPHLWQVQKLDIPAGHQHNCDIQCCASCRYPLRGIFIVWIELVQGLIVQGLIVNNAEKVDTILSQMEQWSILSN